MMIPSDQAAVPARLSVDPGRIGIRYAEAGMIRARGRPTARRRDNLLGDPDAAIRPPPPPQKGVRAVFLHAAFQLARGRKNGPRAE